MPRNFNAFSRRTIEFGGGVPIWAEFPKQCEGGGIIKNTFAEGEIVPAGSPVEFNALTHDAKILKCYKVKALNVVDANTIITVYALPNYPIPAVGEFIMATPDTINGVGIAFAVTALDESVAGEISFTVATSAIAEVAAVNGVYTLSITTKPANGDKFSLDGTVYEYATAEGAGVYAIGTNALEAASNVEDAVSAQYAGIFSVTALNGKLVFKQLTPGIGAIPALVVTPLAVTGTLAATIETTTVGVAPKGNEIIVGSYLAQSSATAAGSGKSLYCQPNSLTINDTVVATQNLVGIARGCKYIYKNTMNPAPDVVLNNIKCLEFAYVGELQNSGYVV